MNKAFLKKTLFIIAGILIVSVIMAFITNKLILDNQSFFYNYLDIIFFVNLPVFIVGSVMYISESGLFNVFIYSTYKVRSVISDKYRYALKESEDIRDSEISEHLRNKYLFKQSKYEWTLPIFIASSVIFICILLAVITFYGL